jgi:diguanylate cyclase (GGDEF)-like protein
VARVGGDEFVVVAPRMTEVGLRSLSRRIVTSLEEPHQLHGEQVRVGVSVGRHLASSDEDADAVLAAADARMYDDKRRRKTGPQA